MAGRRLERLNEQLRQEISDIVLNVMNDPRLAGVVSFTGAKISPDLSQANVYFSVLGDASRRKEVGIALRNAAGFLRRELAQRIVLKRMPELSFFYDESLERGGRIMQILQSLEYSTEEGDGDD